MSLNVLTVEAQGYLDYVMLWRCMNNDDFDYEKQLKEFKKINQKEGQYGVNSVRLRLVKGTNLPTLLIPCACTMAVSPDGLQSHGDMMIFGENLDL